MQFRTIQAHIANLQFHRPACALLSLVVFICLLFTVSQSATNHLPSRAKAPWAAQDQPFDPFKFIEHDGYFYGRGTVDVKDEAAALIANMMDPWATDGLFLRRAGIPVYGAPGVFFDIDPIRAHGKDERVGVQAFYEGVEFLYRLMKATTAGK